MRIQKWIVAVDGLEELQTFGSLFVMAFLQGDGQLFVLVLGQHFTFGTVEVVFECHFERRSSSHVRHEHVECDVFAIVHRVDVIPDALVHQMAVGVVVELVIESSAGENHRVLT